MVIWTGCNGIGEDNGDDIYINKPQFISNSFIEVDENKIDIIVLKVKANSKVKYAIEFGKDANIFSLNDNGKLKFKLLLDTKHPKDTDKDNIYEVSVSATDSSGVKTIQALSIEVISASKNILLPYFVTTNTLTVSDGTIDIMTVKAENYDRVHYVIFGGVDKKLLSIGLYSGELTFNQAVNFNQPLDANSDNIYEITVIATTSNNYQSVQNIKIIVTNQKISTPVFDSSPENIIVENQFRAHQIHATGNGNIKYSIVGGDDSLLFKIYSNDGKLNFIKKPNYLNPLDKDSDNKYSLTIQAIDAVDSYAIQNIIITVTKMEENLSFITTSSVDAIEGNQLSFSVEAVGASGMVYNLDGTEDDALFTIGATTGKLNFKKLPDFEAPDDSDRDNHYNITVKATATSGNSAIMNITIIVADKKETEIGFLSQSAIDSIENKKDVFMAKAIGGTNIEYSLADEKDGELFDVDINTGQVSFISTPDFEMPKDDDMDNQYHITLVASNSAGNLVRQNVDINIADVKELVVPLLVVLVQYSNYKFNSSESVWSQKIFGTNHGELNDYYNEISYGKFRFSKVRDSQGSHHDGVVTVTLDEELSSDISSGEFRKRAKDALILADAYVNFARYDKNRNGELDRKEMQILFVSAGGENAVGVHPGIWAHSTAISDHWYKRFKLDGIRVINKSCDGSYVVVGERHKNNDNYFDANIGLIAHEFGHSVFELPDLYDTDHSSAGVGYFGLMGYGSYGHKEEELDGKTPTHMIGWSKIKCGFIQPTIIDSNISNLAVVETASIDYGLYKIPTGKKNEYFLIENRNNNGYDNGLYALNDNYSYFGGLSILHIDDNVDDNDKDTHRLVDIEEANSLELDKNDDNMTHRGNEKNLFYASNSDEFTPYTIPNSNRYDGQSSGISITNISKRLSVMYIDINIE